MSANVSMKALLESGVHFGHRTNKWDPRMRPYIFTERNGIHIIDLQQTVKYLEVAYNIVRDSVANGGTVMFVGTKRQAQETIQEEAIRCGMPYVTERWLPGTLTNWTTIYARIMELERLEKLRDSGEIDRLVKKEGLMIEREINRLLTTLVGIRNMKRLPELLFIIDVSREMTAVHEANLKNIPIVALVDTNCDPSGVDYIVPANDDAIRAIKLLVGKIADAVLEGKAMRKEEVVDEAGLLADEAARAADLSRGHIELEVELGDEDLLGTSTLAKLASVKPAIAEIIAADIKAEEIVKPVEKVKSAKPASAKPVIAEIIAADIKPEEIEKPVEKVKPTRKKKIVKEPVLDKPEAKKQDKE